MNEDDQKLLPKTNEEKIMSICAGELNTSADQEPFTGPRVFGHARWRKDWVKVSSELAQGRRAWSASI